MEPMFEEALASVSLKFGADFQLKARQKDALKHIWAWDDTDKQDLDLIVNLPTGYGKSIIFQMLPDLLSCLSQRVCDFGNVPPEPHPGGSAGSIEGTG